ncbi:isochorismate synthase [Salinibius halmophilus]|uniref:isochorismate synthase n=1 Tax=Salinibius halmophilus TaxID=1853216 RepID=UPI000E66EF59|nr:isochorismate synthase [Salinibius halmophilus]
MMTAHAAVALKPAQTLHELVHQLAQTKPKPGIIQQLSIELAPVNALAIMAANLQAEQCYWRDRNGDIEMAGFGSAIDIAGHNQQALSDTLSIIESLNDKSDADLLWFGGFAFDESQQHKMPYSYFRLPQIAVVQQQGKCRLLVHLYSEDIAPTNELLKAAIEAISWQEAPLTQNKYLYSLDHNCDIHLWRQKVAQALESFANNQMTKVVLTRTTSIRTARNIPVHSLLHKWQQARQNAYSFMLQLGTQHFIGHSPERLFRRQNNYLTTDALAGTVKLDTQGALAQLQTDPKLVHEHAVVADYIQQQLHNVSKTVIRGQTKVMSLRNIAHRHCTLNAQLWPTTSTTDVIKQLHPTPAVGGFPRQNALAYLSVNECNRDWYAGGVGIIGRWQKSHYSDFSVAIRSALVTGNKMTLFTGVGIVNGSDADEEWLELDGKLASVLGALNDG